MSLPMGSSNPTGVAIMGIQMPLKVGISRPSSNTISEYVVAASISDCTLMSEGLETLELEDRLGMEAATST